MFSISASFDTIGSPTQTFDHIGRRFFANHGRWDPMVRAMTHDRPVVGEGSTGTETRQMGLARFSNTVRVVEFRPDTAFGFEATSGPLREEMRCGIEPNATGGSRVTVRLTFRTAAAWSRVAEPLLKAIVTANARKNMDRIRAALDADATAAPPTR